MRKTIIIHIFFAIISAIVYVEGILTKGPDLIWNMFLALIAYDTAFLAIQFKKKWFFLPVILLWLALYPNTFYMITDLVHMHWVSDTLWNRESLHLFMAFVPSIFFGVLCGIASLQRESLLFILGFTFIQIMSLVFLSKNQSK